MSNLESLKGKIEKIFGEGSLMKLGGDYKADISIIPSGSFAINRVLGIGGYPCGRVIEIYGPEASGKTTLALHATAECQKQGGTVCYIDVENCLDVKYMKALGVDVDNLLVAQPDYGEQALNMVEEMIKTKEADLVIIDSVAALVPKKELDGEMGERHLGSHARLMSQALRKLTALINKTNTCVIFINQIRMKIGVMYGSPEVTTGGQALKFYSSVRLEVRRKGYMTNKSDEKTGTETRIKISKNKVAPPFKECIVDIEFGIGIVKELDLINECVHRGIIYKKGGWLYYTLKSKEKIKEIGKEWDLKDTTDVIKVNGIEKFKVMLQEDKELYNKLKGEL
jgi:recombination protein RecA